MAKDARIMPHCKSVIDWLLNSDPSIRWQVMRDLLDVPESEWTAERAKVEIGCFGHGHYPSASFSAAARCP